MLRAAANAVGVTAGGTGLTVGVTVGVAVGEAVERQDCEGVSTLVATSPLCSELFLLLLVLGDLPSSESGTVAPISFSDEVMGSTYTQPFFGLGIKTGAGLLSFPDVLEEVQSRDPASDVLEEDLSGDAAPDFLEL
jgi:hypothetical protein